MEIVGVYVVLGLACMLGLLLAISIQLFAISTRVADIEEVIDEAEADKDDIKSLACKKATSSRLQGLQEPRPWFKTSASPASSSSTTLSDIDMAERGGLQIITEERGEGDLRRCQSDSACLDAYFKPSLGVRRRR